MSVKYNKVWVHELQMSFMYVIAYVYSPNCELANSSQNHLLKVLCDGEGTLNDACKHH